MVQGLLLLVSAVPSLLAWVKIGWERNGMFTTREMTLSAVHWILTHTHSDCVCWRFQTYPLLGRSSAPTAAGSDSLVLPARLSFGEDASGWHPKMSCLHITASRESKSDTQDDDDGGGGDDYWYVYCYYLVLLIKFDDDQEIHMNSWPRSGNWELDTVFRTSLV